MSCFSALRGVSRDSTAAPPPTCQWSSMSTAADRAPPTRVPKPKLLPEASAWAVTSRPRHSAPARIQRYSPIPSSKSAEEYPTPANPRQLPERSEEHTSELQSLIHTQYAVF